MNGENSALRGPERGSERGLGGVAVEGCEGCTALPAPHAAPCSEPSYCRVGLQPRGSHSDALVAARAETDVELVRRESEIYFSDDSRRMLVLIKSQVPVVGSLSLHLKEYRPGR